jgi:triacylglycerol lipase
MSPSAKFRMKLTETIALILLLQPVFPAMAGSDAGETKPAGNVVLLHGLARSDKSFKRMQRALKEHGYVTCNIAYPSTRYAMEKLVTDFVLPEIYKCFGEAPSQPIDFVTHSMGGIIVRVIGQQGTPIRFGNVVMLSPPNKGSEVVDKLGDWWLFQKINGPAGIELGTDSSSTPNRLGKPSFSLGIITGDQSINWILSTMIEGTDDGKVSVESAKLDGMVDFIVIPATHTFIMNDQVAIEQVLYFLEKGYFNKPQETLL